MNLTEWQHRLQLHFEELRRTRSDSRPIFALEHGLNSPGLTDLERGIKAHIDQSLPSKEHWLCWIVYAAEIGYRYSGDEYWQTFEAETPRWTIYGDRYWIRECFLLFHSKFGGAKPSGKWAEHFSIICWPITHALLPRDLQQQLARILYELRHSFSAELFESPSMLGEFIAARSWNATSRFQNLAQETLLIGQIAAGLLLEGAFGTGSLIYPATLRRIAEDLDRERRAREWLRGARRLAQERAQIRGLALGRGPALAVSRHTDEGRAEVAALGIEPRLMLRPTDRSGGSWEVLLEIPDLSHLLIRFPETREILTGARCAVAGAAGRPLARGRCLHGAQRVTLSRWPRTDEILLAFEQRNAQLEYLLSTECLLRSGPTWLFRIASDGLAYELRTLRVRPGERYIIVNTAGSMRASANTQTVALDCEGVDGAILDLPRALTMDWQETVRTLGLGQAKTIEVWPAGLDAVVWDGEGHGEWLASERPCLGISSDHPIDSLLVSMGASNGLSIELTSILPGEPMFVELPQLPVGLHTIRVLTRDAPTTEVEPLGNLDVVMRIREARPWSPGVSSHGPLLVQMEPAAATLEQLWEGRAELTIQGPLGRHVNCTVSLFEKETDAPAAARQLPPLPLPVTPDRWEGHFEKYFRETREAEAAYDTARVCQLEFAAEELGAFSVRCEREFTPIRWAVRGVGREYLLRLIDDSGDPTPRFVARMAFEAPSVEEALEPIPEYRVPTPGGLYVARSAEFEAAVIVPPSVRGLKDLKCVPCIDGRERSTEALVRAIALARLWRRARLTGDLLSKTRQCTVLHAFASHIFRLIGGDNWTGAELSVRDREDGLIELKRAVSRRPQEIGIGAALIRDYAALAVATSKDKVGRLGSLASKFLALPSTPVSGVSNANNVEWLAEFALRLASDPAEVEVWAGQHLRVGLARLLELPTLARAARFLVLATDHHLQSRTASSELYAGWGWT